MKETSEKVNEYTQCRTRTLFKETSTTISIIAEADQNVRQGDSFALELFKNHIYLVFN